MDADVVDAGVGDGGGPCAAMDAAQGAPCGPAEDPALLWMWDGSACRMTAWCHCVGADCAALYASEAACASAYGTCGPACASDRDCAAGAAWCEGGRCVPCDNSGLVCRIACPTGWSTYRRNECNPCECAPDNECASDSDCLGGVCHSGAFCWCEPAEPGCCMGNTCSAAGCAGPNPAGCFTTGCPRGQECVDAGCASSACACTAGGWACTDDCGGGTCVARP